MALASCTSESVSTSLKADVILLDISGSNANSEGTYNEENHSPSSLSERRRQLENKIKNAISTKTAIYFGFVRLGYGVTDIATLVPPSLILDINNVISSEIENPRNQREALESISKAWQSAISQESTNPDSCSTETLASFIVSGSKARVSAENIQRIAGKLCLGARNAIYQFDEIKGEPDDIGSDVQAAVDRSLQKLASEEKRLINSDGKYVELITTLIIVSDLIQVTDGKSIVGVVSATTDPKKACDLARQDSKNFKTALLGSVSVISDGFAGTIKEVKSSDRDKLKRYWECWLGARNVTDIDIGAKGIDIGAL